MAVEVKPIRSEADHEAALAEVERLWGAKAGTPKGDRLDVLATLIDAYEAAHYPMDPPDAVEAIKFRMEQLGLTRKDLEGIIGTRTRIAEVLNRRRRLSINIILPLHRPPPPNPRAPHPRAPPANQHDPPGPRPARNPGGDPHPQGQGLHASRARPV